MAETSLAGRNFDLGFQSDVSRDQLPRGAAFRMRDYVPQLGSPLRKRGGYSHATKDLNAESSATRMTGAAWVPFQSDPHLITISDGGKLYSCKVFDGSAGTFVGLTGFSAGITHKPFWHLDRSIIMQALGQAGAGPQKYHEVAGVDTLAAVGGSPPQARAGWSFGDYVAFANGYVSSTLFPNRIWYSDVGNPDAYQTGTSFWDMSELEEIVCGVTLRNVQLVWGYTQMWMITGDTPPAGGNFASRPIFKSNGCMDARSLSTWREYAIWANNSGVYRTDGATLTDLTYVGGIQQYWRALCATFSRQQGWSAAGGVLAGMYHITIINAAGAVVTTLVCDLERKVWWEYTNIPSLMYAERTSGPGTATVDGHEEMFFASRDIPRAEYCSTFLSPSSAVANDADGDAVLPEIETPFYKLSSPEEKRIRRAFFTYDIRTAGASPYLQVAHLTDPSETSYTNCTPTGTLPTTTKQTRRHVDVRRKGLGVAFKLTQVGASADTRLHDIELEGHGLDSAR